MVAGNIAGCHGSPVPRRAERRARSPRPFEPDPGHAGGGRWIMRILVLGLAAALLAGCSGSGGGNPGERTVVLITHDAFTMKPEVLEEFRKSSGIKIDVRKT